MYYMKPKTAYASLALEPTKCFFPGFHLALECCLATTAIVLPVITKRKEKITKNEKIRGYFSNLTSLKRMIVVAPGTSARERDDNGNGPSVELAPESVLQVFRNREMHEL